MRKHAKKVYLPVGIVFKGSGFYATDHPPSIKSGTKADEVINQWKKKKVKIKVRQVRQTRKLLLKTLKAARPKHREERIKMI
jgi:hypothetical protein